MLSAILNFITGAITGYGSLGVALLMAVESAAIPLPSEIIMPFAGFLVYQGKLTLMAAALAGAVGSVLGSWVIYWLAAVGGRPLIYKYSKWVLVSKGDFEKTILFFHRYGGWATFLGRMLPIVRTYISIPAGLVKAPFWPFTAAAFAGSFIWSYFLAYLGFKLGPLWPKIHELGKKFDVFVGAILILVVVFYLYRHYKSRIDKTDLSI